MRDLVPFVQFKKREKHPRRSDTFSKVAGNITNVDIHSNFEEEICIFLSQLSHEKLLRKVFAIIFWNYLRSINSCLSK